MRPTCGASALLDDADVAAIADEAARLAADVRMRMNADVTVDPAELFEHVYARPTAALERQRAALLDELQTGSGGGAMSTVTSPAIVPGRLRAASGRQAPAPVTMAAALNQALADALAADDRVVVFGEDVGTLGGVFRVTDGLAARFGEQRVFDTPLAEAGIVGTAIGMAMAGLVPVIEMQFDAFAYPAFEQVTSHLAKLRNRTRGKLALPVVIRIPYGGGIGGVEHHSDSSEAYYTHTPGLRVVDPRHPGRRLPAAAPGHHLPRPGHLPRAQAPLLVTRDDRADAPGPPIDRAVLRRPGKDVTLIAYGAMVATALEAAEAATEEGWDVEVIDLRSLSPVDDQTLTESVRRTGRAVVVHEAAGFAGYGAEIAAGSPSSASSTWRRRCCASPAWTSRTRRRTWSSTTCRAPTASWTRSPAWPGSDGDLTAGGPGSRGCDHEPGPWGGKATGGSGLPWLSWYYRRPRARSTSRWSRP